jgi:twitching motility protein PilT
MIRLHGKISPMGAEPLSAAETKALAYRMLTDAQKHKFEENRELDFSFGVKGLARFRANVYLQRGAVAVAIRTIQNKIHTFQELGLPKIVEELCNKPRGLVLVTGPTGSGKSTTLATMVDKINSEKQEHIVTIEDPIEFIHDYKQCVISQREIGDHSPNFAEALRGAVREDPDLIMVGELRDQESISQALTAAEAGIQVLGTLHTRGATGTIDRIVNVFPEKQQELIRHMLADGLRMIVSQRLVPTADHSRRIPAVEILINTSAAATMIRTGQSHKLMTVIQSGRRSGMQSLDGSLKDLMQRKVITAEAAYEHALDRTQFERYLVRMEAA